VEDGALPVFSVDTEEQAEQLLSLTCPKVSSGEMAGEYFSRELAREQSLDVLDEFSDKLTMAWNRWLKPKDEEDVE